MPVKQIWYKGPKNCPWNGKSARAENTKKVPLNAISARDN